MVYRKKTVRAMPETTRELARLINEMDSVQRRLKNLLPRIGRLERDSKALKEHSCAATLRADRPAAHPVCEEGG